MQSCRWHKITPHCDVRMTFLNTPSSSKTPRKHLGNTPGCNPKMFGSSGSNFFTSGFYWLWRLNVPWMLNLHFDCLLHLFLIWCSLAERGMQPIKSHAAVDISDQISSNISLHVSEHDIPTFPDANHGAGICAKKITPKMAQSCRAKYSSTMLRIWDLHPQHEKSSTDKTSGSARSGIIDHHP